MKRLDFGWEKHGEGAWIRPSDKATITKVSPKGLTLYCLRMPDSNVPVWLDSLRRAKIAACVAPRTTNVLT